MNKYKNYPFVKLALRFALVFLVLVSFFEIGLSIIKNMSFSIMVNNLFAEDRWQYFVKRIGAMSIFYGLFMAGYYKFIKK